MPCTALQARAVSARPSSGAAASTRGLRPWSGLAGDSSTLPMRGAAVNGRLPAAVDSQRSADSAALPPLPCSAPRHVRPTSTRAVLAEQQVPPQRSSKEPSLPLSAAAADDAPSAWSRRDHLAPRPSSAAAAATHHPVITCMEASPPRPASSVLGPPPPRAKAPKAAKAPQGPKAPKAALQKTAKKVLSKGKGVGVAANGAKAVGTLRFKRRRR